MHTKTMAEHEGTFKELEKTERPCHKCKGTNVTVQDWDSSCGGYTDYKYTCGDCKHVWWVDGIDS